MTIQDRVAAVEAANVTLDTENAQLRQALRAIRKGLSEDADGEFWSARRWLDQRNIFHGDLSGNRVLELVAKHALHGKLAEFSAPEGRPEPTSPKRPVIDEYGICAKHDHFRCDACAPPVEPSAPVTPEPPLCGICEAEKATHDLESTDYTGPICSTCHPASEARPTTEDTPKATEFSPDGHYVRSAVENLTPEVKAASEAVFEQVPDLIERLNRIRKLILAVQSSAPSAPEGRTLKDYRPQHDQECLANICADCRLPAPHSDGDFCSGGAIRLACSCGLSALLAVSHG